MNLKFWFVVFIILLNISCFPQKAALKKDNGNLYALCKTIDTAHSNVKAIVSFEYTKQINFDSLTYEKEMSLDTTKSNYFKIGLTEKSRIYSVRYYEDGDLRYELRRLITFDDVKIFAMIRREFNWPDKPNRVSLQVAGFLVYLDSMNFVIHYDHSNLAATMLKISHLMFVDKDLNVKSYCAFDGLRITHVATVRYYDGEIDRLTLYNPYFCEKLNYNSNISDFKFYNRNKYELQYAYGYISSVRLRKNKGFLKYPLWLWGGEFGYE